MVQKPTIYLYGKDQVPLPKLPDWDKEKYPYGAIVQSMDQGFALIVSNTPLSASSDALWFGENWQAYRVHGTEFVLSTTSNSAESMDGIVWANCNIYEFSFLGVTDVVVFEKSADPTLDTTEHAYCLCNDMLLPVFPELPYNYAVIAFNDDDEVWLYCSITKYCLFNNGYVTADGSNTGNISYVCTGTEWMVMPARVGHSLTIHGDLFWSNHDIIDVNGTVGEVGSIYFPKSADPVPFEPNPVPQLNPAILTKGYIAGLSI